jgi:GNAT superfamily N-acetyltransferase
MKRELNWEVGCYEERDKPGILALNRVLYGDVAISHKAYFDWLTAQNPAGEAVVPVAREKETGKVVGFIFHLPMRVSWAGEECLGILAVNVVVDRAYRRQGIYWAVQDAGLKGCERYNPHFTYVFPNHLSLKALMKWNYHVVSQIPILVRPLDISALTKTYFNNLLVQWGVDLGWRIGGVTIWRRRCPCRDLSSSSIVEDGEFDEGYDRFWEQVKFKYDLMLIRDRAFLQWRFLDIPYRNYQVLSARQGTDILGYIVLREADIRGVMVGLIADFLVLPGERGNQAGSHLLYEVLQRFGKVQLPVSGGLALPHTQEFTLMQKAGYLRPPQSFAPQSFHLVVENLSDDVPSSALMDPGKWYVSIADHDAA